MKLNYVLIVTKDTSQKDSKEFLLLRTKDPVLHKEMVSNKRLHSEAATYISKTLDEQGIRYEVILRNDLESKKGVPRADLIISIGGDGTFLSTVAIAGETPILGVNSMPRKSRGFFCSTDISNFDRYLFSMISGETKPTSLPLLEAAIDERKIHYPVINDILFSGTTPAETVKYLLKAGSRQERQKGSGVWISAGPGSTGGIRSAGGRVTPVRSKRLQFLARELCVSPKTRYSLKKGILSEGEEILIIAESSNGRVYPDGKDYPKPIPIGSRITVKVSSKTLSVFL